MYGLCGAGNLLTPLSGIENALSEIEQGKQIHPSILSFVFIFFSIFRPDATRAGAHVGQIIAQSFLSGDTGATQAVRIPLYKL